MKGVVYMSDKGKKILETFEKTIPRMSEMEKEKLLYFAEGMAFKINQKLEQNATEDIKVDR